MPPTVSWSVSGSTSMESTATALTTTFAESLTPSDVASTHVMPTATPVTLPVASTPAVAPSRLSHVTTRPVSTLPASSKTVAVRLPMPPTASWSVSGSTSMESTETALTTTFAESLTPSDVASTQVMPTAAPVTLPVASTPAIAPSRLSHVTTRPVSTLPASSKTVAVRLPMPPTVSWSVSGSTSIESTATGLTTTFADPTMPSTVAVTSVMPTATPVAIPVATSIVTIVGSSVPHVTGRPSRRFPAASKASAVKATIPPTRISVESGETTTPSTRGGAASVTTMTA